MIGFTIPVVVWHDGGRDHETAILTLDLDGDDPQADLRLAGGDTVVNCDPEDLYTAVNALHTEFRSWEWERDSKVESEARA